MTMASEQLSREDNSSTNRGDPVEKDLVPKMASHYETPAEKAKEPAVTVVGGKDCQSKQTQSKDAREIKEEDGGNDGDSKEESAQESQQKPGDGNHGGEKEESEKGERGKGDMLDSAREKVSSVKDTVEEAAGKTLGSVKDAVTGITEKAKEFTVGKTEEGGRDQQQQEKEARYRNGGNEQVHAKEGKLGWILGAVGETLVEIAVSTKDLVFGKGQGYHQRGVKGDDVYDYRRREQKEGNEH